MDARFSKQQFLTQPEGLSQELQNAVLDRLHRVVDLEFRRIVAELNTLGHRLVEYDVEPGSIHFRDDFDEAGKEQECDLLLAVDIVITAGYRNTIER